MPGKTNTNNNPFQQTFKKVDHASGGIAGQVVGSVKDAVSESAQQVATTPIEVLKTFIGTGDASIETSTTGSDPNDPNTGQSSEFSKKLEEDRKKREASLRQHRLVLNQYEQAFKRKQAEEKQLKQYQDQQEEREKEQTKAQAKPPGKLPKWMQALRSKIGPGKSETGKSGS